MKEYELESFRETQAEYKKWEEGLEGVAYWLGDLPVPEPLERVIIEAVHKLPSEVREFTYHNFQFTSMDDDGVRMCHIPQASRSWLIALGERRVDENRIIHEIAHVWLGHEYDPQCGELQVTQRDEQAAWDLTRQWGFDGDGAVCSAHVR